MVTKEEMLKGVNALEGLILAQERLRKDGLIFIFELGKWEDFMKFHAKQEIERNSNVKSV